MKQLIIFLSLFLVSCNDFPTIRPQERCFVVLDGKVNDGQTDYFSGHCRCHLYEWSRSHIGRISDSENHSLEYCDKLGGFNPDSTGAIYSWEESIRLWLIRKENN